MGEEVKCKCGEVIGTVVGPNRDRLRFEVNAGICKGSAPVTYTCHRCGRTDTWCGPGADEEEASDT